MLAELGIEPDDPRLIEVWNKIDRLDADERARDLQSRRAAAGIERRPVLVSALSGEGIERLLAAIEARLGEKRGRLFNCRSTLPTARG